MTVRIICGDAREKLAELPAASVHCCVTSPPYFGLRDYGVAGQIGLEPSPDAYVAELVAVFREVRRVLRDDGTLWLNLGDSYSSGGRDSYGTFDPASKQASHAAIKSARRPPLPSGCKPKDLLGIPWMVAFALRADGWWLRQRLPWVKRNPMPESTLDRPTSAAEDVFLLSKSSTYFYDYDAVLQRMVVGSVARLAQDVDAQTGSARANGGGKTNGAMKAVRRSDKQRGHTRRHAGFNDRWDAMERDEQRQQRAFRNTDLFFASVEAPFGAIGDENGIIALDVATHPYKESHFATFPPKLIEPLMLAGCPAGGTVLDPFGGAGTTALVADRLGRDAILIELNPEYAAMAEQRLRGDAGMFAAVEAA